MKIINIPNAVTFLRLLLLPVVMIFLVNQQTILAVALYLVFLGTDALDGFLARRLKQETDFGEYFDFAVDFLGFYTFLIYFIVTGRIVIINSILICLASLALIWIGVSLSKKARRLYMPHRTSGKVLAVLLNVSIFLFIIDYQHQNITLGLALVTIMTYTIPDYIRFSRS